MTPTLDRLRILIALAVLRNTPVDQTHSSYILFLRDAFPSSEAPFGFWRSHAHQLERECIELRATLEKLRIRSFIDTHATQPAEYSEPPVSSSSGSNDLLVMKKKFKKKPDATAESEAVNLADILKFGIRLGLYTDQVESLVSLRKVVAPLTLVFSKIGRPFEAMDTFLQLWSLSDRPSFPRKAFFAATRDVCKALSSAFDDATRERTNLKTLQVVQATICAVVDKAVPLVRSWVTENDEALSLLFSNLLDLFINPVIPAFLVISERNLSYMQNADSGDSPAPPSADYVDGRVSILALLQITFSHIQSALSISADNISGGGNWISHSLALARSKFTVMIHWLILTIVRHLRDILREGAIGHKQKPTRRRRIKRLAVKDTFWYLCSTVHFLLDLLDRALDLNMSDGTSTKDLPHEQHRLDLLKHTTLDILVDLVLCQDRKRASIFTERHDLLTTKPILQGSVEPQELSLSSTLNSKSEVQATNYLVLDDMGYRMFLSLVERLLCRD